MKTGTVAVVFAGVVVAAGITYSFMSNRGASGRKEPPAAAKTEVSPEVIHVDDLAKDPGSFEGEIILRAVVAGVRRSEGVFGVIDSREFESCGVLSCAEDILPVTFAGELPKPKTIVRITGRVVRGERGLIFEARSLEVVP